MGRSRLNGVPLKDMLVSKPPVFMHVILFGDGVFAECNCVKMRSLG